MELFIARYTTLPAEIRFYDTGVDGKAFTFNQASVHATRSTSFEQQAKEFVAPKTAVTIFGKGRVIGDFIFKA